jgi:hypothetical protein
VSEVVVVKSENGKLEGLGEKGGRAWRRFQAWVAEMAVGDTLRFEWHKPRSLQHHRHFFAMLNALFDAQERFDDENKMRQWLTVGAGYCDFVPGPAGVMCALPQSIAFHRLDESEFSELRGAVDRFLWTDAARKFLWPHLSDRASYEAVDRLLGEFR